MKSVPFLKGRDHALVIGWTESWVKAPEKIFKILNRMGVLKSCFFQAGHAGLVLICGKTGSVEYFDFGRYTTPKGYGRIRSERTDPKLSIPLRAQFDESGDLINFETIVGYVDSMPEKTHGDGIMNVSICKNISFQHTKNYIEQQQFSGLLEYRTFKKGTTNCAQFVTNALLAGVTCPKTRQRLKYPFTVLRGSPLGNVEAVESESNFIISNGEIHEKKRKNRISVLGIFIKASLKNFTGKNISGRFPDCLNTPDKHEKILENAQWLPGLGEGTWLSLLPFDEQKKLYRIIAQGADGKLEYDFVGSSNGERIDHQSPFKFLYGTTRLWATIAQDNKLITINFQYDFQQKFISINSHFEGSQAVYFSEN